MRISQLQNLLITAITLLLLSGCATGKVPPTEIHDPFEKVNRVVYKFNDTLDRVALKPIASGYKRVTPTAVRLGVSNFFGNLGDVTVAANSLLQGKFEQGLLDTARVAVNTTLGIGGVLDVASKLDLERHNEDFGQTLGVWGVPEGPYIVLPFFGSQTLRSTAGLIGDSQVEPLNSSRVPTSVRGKLVALNVINARSNLLAASSILDTASLDPYIFMRDGYLNWRRQQVHPKQSNTVATPDSGDELDELDDLNDSDELDELDILDDTDDEPDTPSTNYPPDELDLLDDL